MQMEMCLFLLLLHNNLDLCCYVDGDVPVSASPPKQFRSVLLCRWRCLCFCFSSTTIQICAVMQMEMSLFLLLLHNNLDLCCYVDGEVPVSASPPQQFRSVLLCRWRGPCFCFYSTTIQICAVMQMEMCLFLLLLHNNLDLCCSVDGEVPVSASPPQQFRCCCVVMQMERCLFLLLLHNNLDLCCYVDGDVPVSASPPQQFRSVLLCRWRCACFCFSSTTIQICAVMQMEMSVFLLLLHNNLDLCCYVDGDVPVSASPPQQFRSVLLCRWRGPCFCFSSTTIQICAVMQMEMCLFLLLLHNNLDLCCYVDGEVPVSASPPQQFRSVLLCRWRGPCFCFSSTTIQICAVMQMERCLFLLLLHNNLDLCCYVDGDVPVSASPPQQFRSVLLCRWRCACFCFSSTTIQICAVMQMERSLFLLLLHNNLDLCCYVDGEVPVSASPPQQFRSVLLCRWRCACFCFSSTIIQICAVMQMEMSLFLLLLHNNLDLCCYVDGEVPVSASPPQQFRSVLLCRWRGPCFCFSSTTIQICAVMQMEMCLFLLLLHNNLDLCCYVDGEVPVSASPPQQFRSVLLCRWRGACFCFSSTTIQICAVMQMERSLFLLLLHNNLDLCCYVDGDVPVSASPPQQFRSVLLCRWRCPCFCFSSTTIQICAVMQMERSLFLLLLHNNLDLCCYVDGEVPVSASPPQQFRSVLLCRWRGACFCLSSTTIQICAVMQMERSLFLLLLHNNLDLCCYVDGEVPVSASPPQQFRSVLLCRWRCPCFCFSSTTIQICAVMQMEMSLFLLLLHNNLDLCCYVDGDVPVSASPPQQFRSVLLCRWRCACFCFSSTIIQICAVLQMERSLFLLLLHNNLDLCCYVDGDVPVSASPPQQFRSVLLCRWRGPCFCFSSTTIQICAVMQMERSMFLLLLQDNLDLCCYVDGDVPVSASPPQQFRSVLLCRWRCPCFCFSSTTIQICAVMQMEMCLFLLLLHNNLDLCCYVDGDVHVSASPPRQFRSVLLCRWRCACFCFSSTTIQICAVMQMEMSLFLLLLHDNLDLCCYVDGDVHVSASVSVSFSSTTIQICAVMQMEMSMFLLLLHNNLDLCCYVDGEVCFCFSSTIIQICAVMQMEMSLFLLLLHNNLDLCCYVDGDVPVSASPPHCFCFSTIQICAVMQMERSLFLLLLHNNLDLCCYVDGDVPVSASPPQQFRSVLLCRWRCACFCFSSTIIQICAVMQMEMSLFLLLLHNNLDLCCQQMDVPVYDNNLDLCCYVDVFLLLLHNNLDLCCYVDGEVHVSASPPQQFRSVLLCRWRCACFCFSSTIIQICAVMQMEMCLFLLLLHNNLELCCYVDGDVHVSASPPRQFRSVLLCRWRCACFCFSSTIIQICAVMQMERCLFLLLLHNNLELCCYVDGDVPVSASPPRQFRSVLLCRWRGPCFCFSSTIIQNCAVMQMEMSLFLLLHDNLDLCCYVDGEVHVSASPPRQFRSVLLCRWRCACFCFSSTTIQICAVMQMEMCLFLLLLHNNLDLCCYVDGDVPVSASPPQQFRSVLLCRWRCPCFCFSSTTIQICAVMQMEMCLFLLLLHNNLDLCCSVDGEVPVSASPPQQFRSVLLCRWRGACFCFSSTTIQICAVMQMEMCLFLLLLHNNLDLCCYVDGDVPVSASPPQQFRSVLLCRWRCPCFCFSSTTIQICAVMQMEMSLFLLLLHNNLDLCCYVDGEVTVSASPPQQFRSVLLCRWRGPCFCFSSTTIQICAVMQMEMSLFLLLLHNNLDLCCYVDGDVPVSASPPQ